MTYRAVLFDLDGTLLDTLEDLGAAVNRVLASRGFPTHPLDDYRYFIGDGAPMMVARALPEQQRNDATLNACLADFREDYGRNWKVKTRPFRGVSEMLDALTARGLRLAVLSNKPHDATEKCVNELLSSWTFDVVMGLREGAPKKPDPWGALQVASYLGISPEDFLYCGDSGVDMKTAVDAGMFPVGALWGFRQADELLAHGAKVLIKNPLEILDLLT